jgi:hypothetical protein
MDKKRKAQSLGLGRSKAPRPPEKRPRCAGLEQPTHLGLIFI